jgi:hypothetical protein
VTFTFGLLKYCLFFGALYLLIVDLVWNKLESFVPTAGNFPRNLFDSKDIGWFVSSFLIEFIFFVLIPAVVYDWYYMLVPLWGIRGGIFLGLFLFLFGMIPFAILLLFRIKIPSVFILYQLIGLLVKVAGCFAIIGYLYSL